jgi:hypothetical protein
MFLATIEMPLQIVLLAMEAHAVIGLRLSKIATGGPGAAKETHRMVAEKVSALAEAAGTILGGGSAQTMIRRYRYHVQANEVRLLGTRRALNAPPPMRRCLPAWARPSPLPFDPYPAKC